MSECQILPEGVCLKEVDLDLARVEKLEEFFWLYRMEFDRALKDLKANNLEPATLSNLMFDLQTDLAAVGDEINERMNSKSKEVGN
jgi:hypothetical protein